MILALFLLDNPYKIWMAYRKGKTQLKIYESLLKRGLMPDKAIEVIKDNKGIISSKTNKKPYNVLLLGHTYNIYDTFINMNIVDKLGKMGCNVIMPEQLSRENIEKGAQEFPRRIFWTMSKKLVGNYFHYIKLNKIDGIIYLISFGCGPDSLIGELIWKWAKKSGEIPFMFMTLDEHTGEAGFNTRLEAFADMIERRAIYEDYVSASR